MLGTYATTLEQNNPPSIKPGIQEQLCPQPHPHLPHTCMWTFKLAYTLLVQVKWFPLVCLNHRSHGPVFCRFKLICLSSVLHVPQANSPSGISLLSKVEPNSAFLEFIQAPTPEFQELYTGTQVPCIRTTQARLVLVNYLMKLAQEAYEPQGKISACVHYLGQGTSRKLVGRPDPRIFSGHIWSGFRLKRIYPEGKQSQAQQPQCRNNALSLGEYSYFNGHTGIRTSIFAWSSRCPQLYVCHNKAR